MNVLVLNCGSSSLKFQIIQTDLEAIKNDQDKMLAKGYIERIGSQAIITLQATGHLPLRTAEPIRDHKSALNFVIKWITDPNTKIESISDLTDIHAIGHRIVHGAEKLKKSVLIDDAVIDQIEECIPLAPLHNPPNLKGIYAAREVFPGIPQVAVFDTAFHSTLPEENYLYAIPYQLYRRFKIRKYGFHGTSHRYVAYRYRKIKGIEREQVTIITLHLGNGCSACAIKNGFSLDTSMGMTPLEGLVMGTRSGDIDPAIVEFLIHNEGSSVEEVFNVLNKRSGLLGISGLTNDMRDLLEEEREHQDRRASLAINIFCNRIKKYIGAYLAELNGADAICFTGGIGENAPEVRRRCLSNLDFFGIKLDNELNEKAVGVKEMKISAPDSKIEVYVIATNEELLIARDTLRVVLNVPRIW
ncbi:MAG: acetate/propionate family kinase [Candidatus Kapaibacteriota bacterium]|jgi:acetate kinase